VRARGYAPDASSWDQREAFNVVVGSRGRPPRLEQRPFFFTGARPLDPVFPARRASLAQVWRTPTVVALVYTFFRGDDRACCPSGDAVIVRFKRTTDGVRPLDAVPSQPAILTASLRASFLAGGSPSVRQSVVVEGSATEPAIAAVLARQPGTPRYRAAVARLLRRIGGRDNELGSYLRTLVDGPPTVNVNEGRARIEFSGATGVPAPASSAAGWKIVRRGGIVGLEAALGSDAPPDVAWNLVADVPDRPIRDRWPSPTADRIQVVNGESRRLLTWMFPPGDSRPVARVEVPITKTERWTLAANWEVFNQLHRVVAALAASALFIPLLWWTRRRRLPRKGEVRGTARLLRALTWLWVVVALASLVQWVAIWAAQATGEHGWSGSDVASIVAVAAPVVATAAVALVAARFSGTPLLVAVLLVAAPAAALAWLAYSLLWFSSDAFDRFLHSAWYRAGVVSAAAFLATMTLVLSLGGLTLLGAAAVRAARSSPSPAAGRLRRIVAACVLLLAVGAVVQVASTVHGDYGGRRLVDAMFDEPFDSGGWGRDLAYGLVYVPFNFSQFVLALLPLVAALALLATFAQAGSHVHSSLFTSADAHYRFLIVLGFCAFVVGTRGTLYGFAFPLAFVIALVVLARSLRPSLERDQGRIDKLNGRPRHEPSIVFRERAELLHRTEEILRIRDRSSTQYSDYVAGRLSRSKYDLATEEAREECARLSIGGPTHQLRLPPDTPPRQLALALGPEASWWRNGIVALTYGLLLAIVPLVYYAYVVASRQLLPDISSNAYLGVFDLVNSMAYELAFWAVAAFVLGALYPYLPGANGALKGATLAAVYGVANGLATWLLPGGGSDWFFRFLQLVLFLSLLGIVLDWRTLAVNRIGWRHLIAHYQVRDIRVIAGYLAPAVGALIVIVAQLRSGQAGDAVTQFIKSIPTFVPPPPPGGGSG
jgi:hypothetical protein